MNESEKEMPAGAQAAESEAAEPCESTSPIDEWRRRIKQRKGVRLAFTIGTVAVSIGGVVAAIAGGVAAAAAETRRKNKKKKKR